MTGILCGIGMFIGSLLILIYACLTYLRVSSTEEMNYKNEQTEKQAKSASRVDLSLILMFICMIITSLSAGHLLYQVITLN